MVTVCLYGCMTWQRLLTCVMKGGMGRAAECEKAGGKSPESRHRRWRGRRVAWREGHHSNVIEFKVGLSTLKGARPHNHRRVPINKYDTRCCLRLPQTDPLEAYAQ